MTKRTRLAPILLLLSALAGCAGHTTATRQSLARPALVVLLVRHAEKADDSRDAPLSEAGRARAQALAASLRSAGIEHIHSSDYARTRDTAAPTAQALGLAVELYDPRDLPSLASKLARTGGRHLVVGHSNTTPALAALLGGDPGAPIDEANEYDRLYVISIKTTGEANSVLLRY